MTFPEGVLRHRDQLLPHQAAFVEAFIRADAPEYQCLVAPQGTGKLVTAAAVVVELINTARAGRVLILVPGALTHQLQHQIRPGVGSIPVSIIRRPDYRELESRTPRGQTMWPEPLVAIVPLDVAKHKDVRLGLAAVRWDLVIIDETHRLAGQTATLVSHLVERKALHRLLLLTTTPAAGEVSSLVPNLATTTWRLQDLVNWSGQRLVQQAQVQSLRYLRSQAELECLSTLDQLVRLVPDDTKSRRIASILLQRAQSSLFSLDPLLLQIQGSLIDATVGEPSVRGAEPEEDEPSDQWAQLKWTDREQARQYVSRLVELLSELQADSKLDALGRAIHEWRMTSAGEALRVCVFCRYADTAAYVAASLRSRLDLPVHCLTGSIPKDERAAAFDAVTADGGLLVLTDAVLEGVSLATVDYAISYDVPRNPMVLEQRRGRVDRIGRTRPLKFLVLEAPSAEGAPDCPEQQEDDPGLFEMTSD